MRGFLGTYAGFSADLNLVLQIAMGIALLIGACLARARRYRAHALCQSAVLILNLFLIAFVMWPTFQFQVMPLLPGKLGRLRVALSIVHGISGAVAELLGIYILLAAGTNLLPRSWRFQRWRLWMRVELALWWIVLAAGVVTYFVWYVPGSHRVLP